MEVLDPELNHTFTDHYLDVEYDLSKVMFICTVNVLHTVPQPLQDRMEVLRIPGYTEQEKHQIAQRFLIPKEYCEATGLTKTNLKFTDEAVTHIIRHYTHEAGRAEPETAKWPTFAASRAQSGCGGQRTSKST